MNKKEYMKKYGKEYYAQPENKARQEARNQLPCEKEKHRVREAERYKLPGEKEKKTENKRKYKMTCRGRYSHYRLDAKERGIPFDLNEEEFKTFWQLPCYYCGDPIEFIGLDRVDNVKGYSLVNVVPCCAPCNTAKLTSSQEEFLIRCSKIAKLHPRST